MYLGLEDIFASYAYHQRPCVSFFFVCSVLQGVEVWSDGARMRIAVVATAAEPGGSDHDAPGGRRAKVGGRVRRYTEHCGSGSVSSCPNHPSSRRGRSAGFWMSSLTGFLELYGGATINMFSLTGK